MLCCKTLILFKTSQTLAQNAGFCSVVFIRFIQAANPFGFRPQVLSCLLFPGSLCQVSGQNLCSTGHSASVCPGHSQLWVSSKFAWVHTKNYPAHSSYFIALSLFLSSGQKIRFLSEFMITTRLPSDQSWDMKGRKIEIYTWMSHSSSLSSLPNLIAVT